jgi:DNA-directed RNA polymerase subunit beta'
MVKNGDEVEKGSSLSDGDKNPHDVLLLNGLPAVQAHLTDEFMKLYSGVSNIKRRNVETFVRAMTNLSTVKSPGDHFNWLRGDVVRTSDVNHFNRNLKTGSRPVESLPALKKLDILSRELHEDWLANMQGNHLRDTLLDAAAEGWKSNLHGTHPIPGMAVGATFGQGTKDKPWRY